MFFSFQDAAFRMEKFLGCSQTDIDKFVVLGKRAQDVAVVNLKKDEDYDDAPDEFIGTLDPFSPNQKVISELKLESSLLKGVSKISCSLCYARANLLPQKLTVGVVKLSRMISLIWPAKVLWCSTRSLPGMSSLGSICTKFGLFDL